MEHHCNVPQVFANAGKSFLYGLQPSLSHQGHTSLINSPNSLASCVEYTKVQVGPESSSPNFGLPCILLRYPPILYQNMMTLLPLLFL